MTKETVKAFVDAADKYDLSLNIGLDNEHNAHYNTDGHKVYLDYDNEVLVETCFYILGGMGKDRPEAEMSVAEFDMIQRISFVGSFEECRLALSEVVKTLTGLATISDINKDLAKLKKRTELY